MGIRSRDAERQAAVSGLRDALHGHAGTPRPEDAARQLPVAQQDAAGRGDEPGDAADRLLHPQPAAEPEEPTEPPGVRALLRNGNYLEIGSVPRRFDRFSPENVAANMPIVDLLTRFAATKNATPAAGCRCHAAAVKAQLRYSSLPVSSLTSGPLRS